MANTCTTTICNKLIELMAQGWTQDEVCAEVGYSAETFIQWRNPDGKFYEPEFAEAYKKAKTLQKAWWDRYGREHLRDRELNTTMYALFRANLHRWGGGASKDEAYRKLEERARRAEKALGIASEEDD